MESDSDPSVSTLVSGRPLTGQTKEIVFNVVQYLKKQKRDYRLDYNVAAAASAATGISERTVYNIIKEARDFPDVLNSKPSNSRLSSGIPLASQAKEIVFNVVQYLKEQKGCYHLDYNVAIAASDATGISESTVYSIVKQAKDLLTTEWNRPSSKTSNGALR